MNDADNETFLSDSETYAMEDEQYLCSGPLPEEDDPAELEAGRPSRW